MSLRTQRLFWCALIGVGTIVLVLLWVPIQSTDMSFSGPSRTVTRYGLLGWMEERVEHNPRRFSPPLGGGEARPPPLAPGEEVWDHRGEFGKDIVVIRVPPPTRTVHYVALLASAVASVGVIWFAGVQPLQKLVRSSRSAPGGMSETHQHE